MKNAIILHGMPSKEEYMDPKVPSVSNMHWFPWLQKQLLVNGVSTQTPEMPNSYEPNYEIWKKEFERFNINNETILVGHSCGGGFLVRWLSENKDKQAGKIVLVAPWIDPFREDTADFFEFKIDPELVLRTKGLVIFNSNDDYPSIQESVKILKNKITGIQIKDFLNYGHFTYKSMGKLDFPELLDELL